MGNSSSQGAAGDASQNAVPAPAETNLGGKGMSKEEKQKLAASALSEVPSECPMHGGAPPPTSGCPVQHGGAGKENVDPTNMVRIEMILLHKIGEIVLMYP